MNKILLLCVVFALASCNNETKESKTAEPATTDGTTASADVKLPIPLEMPYRNWAIGSTDNVVAGMTMLKAFVDKDNAALAAGIGDSIQLDFDLFQAKLSRDSAMKTFAAERARYTELKITMYDYVSVISADKTQEWVTLWYKQTWKDTKGVVDSSSIVDDMRFEKGKMVELSEKVSRFMKK
jgi:hypothetical protein